MQRVPPANRSIGRTSRGLHGKKARPVWNRHVAWSWRAFWNSLLLRSLFGALAMIAPVRAADIEFVTQELPWAVIDRPYSFGPLEIRSSGRCPLGGVGYSVVGGALPPGVDMSKLGYFSGSPQRNGLFGFAIRVSDGCTWVARRFVLTVTGAPVITVAPDRLTFDGPGEKLVRISATWPRLAYGATLEGGVTTSAVPVSGFALSTGVPGDTPWVKISPLHGFTPRESSALAADDVVVTVNPAGLKPGHYSAQISISAWQAMVAPTVRVELEVTEKRAPSGSPTSVFLP